MDDEQLGTAYSTWERGSGQKRSPFLGSAVITTAPWFYLASLIIFGARMDPRWSNGWERRPAFDPTTVTLTLWVSALLACMAVAIGIRRWKRAGHSPDHNRKWSSLAFVVISLASSLTWVVWQLDSTVRSWGTLLRTLTVGRDNYADQVPPTLLLPIAIAGVAGVIGLVTYLRPRRDLAAPENPYRSA